MPSINMWAQKKRNNNEELAIQRQNNHLMADTALKMVQ